MKFRRIRRTLRISASWTASAFAFVTASAFSADDFAGIGDRRVHQEFHFVQDYILMNLMNLMNYQMKIQMKIQMMQLEQHK